MHFLGCVFGLFCTKATSSSVSCAKQFRLGNYWRMRPLWVSVWRSWLNRRAKVGRPRRVSPTSDMPARQGWIERVVVPIHGNQTLKIGLQRSLMRIIPVGEDDL